MSVRPNYQGVKFLPFSLSVFEQSDDFSWLPRDIVCEMLMRLDPEVLTSLFKAPWPLDHTHHLRNSD